MRRRYRADQRVTDEAARQPLKLSALDAEDLAIISAHMQDATLLVGDISYLPRQKKLALVANRFDWEAAALGGDVKRRGFRRSRCGLQINRVFEVKFTNLRRDAPTAVLSLLAILFHPGQEAPGGVIELTFSGGGAIRAEVECIEAALEDLGLSWETPHKPVHADVASGN